MTSTFVTKAALIAKRKFERKPRPERREKKVIPVREETKAVAEKKVSCSQLVDRKELG